jgi:hypothetical protein
MGDAYVVGQTASTNFPVVNALQATNGGGTCADSTGNPHPCTDAFLAELSPSGSFLLQSTYLGGAGDDGGSAVALDTANNIYLTGFTTSSFPSPGSVPVGSNLGQDAFVIRIGAQTTPITTPLPPVTTAAPTFTSASAAPTLTPTPLAKQCHHGKKLIHGGCRCKKGQHLVRGRCKKIRL